MKVLVEIPDPGADNSGALVFCSVVCPYVVCQSADDAPISEWYCTMCATSGRYLCLDRHALEADESDRPMRCDACRAAEQAARDLRKSDGTQGG